MRDFADAIDNLAHKINIRKSHIASQFNIRKIFKELEKITVKEEDFDNSDYSASELMDNFKDHINDNGSQAFQEELIDNGEIDIEVKMERGISDQNVFFSKVSSASLGLQNKLSSLKSKNKIQVKDKDVVKNIKVEKFKRIVINKTFSQCIYYLNKSFKKIKESYLLDNNLNTKKPRKKVTLANIPKTKKQLLKSNDVNLKYLLNIIMGIEMTIGATPNINILETDDISKYMKSLKYPVATATLTGADDIYYIVDHAGILFNNIRKAFGIEKEQFIQSISPKDFITEMMISYTTNIEELISTSKSGSLFYYTRDGKYILKTIPKKEFKFFKKILKDYFSYLIKNKSTLLPKFYGCYKLVRQLKTVKLDTIYFVVMDNLFKTDKDIHLRYDLKGSTYHRQVIKVGEEAALNGKVADFALKDNDLINNKQFFYLGVIV